MTRRNIFRSLLVSFFSITVLSAFVPVGKNPDAILGVWLTGSGKARIKIYKDDKNKFHGKIVWLRDPNTAEGTPKVDKNNPDDEKKKLPLMGLLNLRDFSFDAEEGIWIDGRIYDPENGNDYSCKMEMTDENTLEVRGFIGISLFGRTEIWKRQVQKK